MGQSFTTPSSHPLHFNLNNWSPSPISSEPEPQQQPLSYGSYIRLTNKMTGQQINEYKLLLSNQEDYQQFLEMLVFRNGSQLLVDVDYFTEEKIDHLCSLVVDVKLYIRHFPLRLGNVKEVSVQESLYILGRGLAGFGMLYRRVGAFNITEELVCVNEEGIVKTWVNANLAKFYSQANHNYNYSNNNSNNSNLNNNFIDNLRTGYFQSCGKPSSAYLSQSQTQRNSNSQNTMVWQLITILEQITNKQTLLHPQGVSFIDYLKNINKSHLTFTLAQQLVISYAKKYEIEIPEVFQSALRVVRERKGIFDSEVDVTKTNMMNMEIKNKVEEIDINNLGSRFKESKVERVKSVKNQLMGSFIASESNHTFADKLKNYDIAKARLNGFGKASDSKDTPIKQSVGLVENKQPMTERIVPNQMSFSSVSSPQAQSMTVIAQLNRIGTMPNSSSNSEIISNQKEKNPLTLSESPLKDKPMTYFSQYIDPIENQAKIIKKPTIFSFGEGHDEVNAVLSQSKANDKLLMNAPVTQSLENSKNSKEPHPQNRPLVTFTYNNANQPQLFTSFRQIKTQPIPATAPAPAPVTTPTMIRSQSNDQMDMPFSPPSVDKSCLSFDFVKKFERSQKNNEEQEKKDKNNQITPSKQVTSKQFAKEVYESLYQKASQKIPSEKNKPKIEQKKQIEMIESPLIGSENKVEISRDQPSNILAYSQSAVISPYIQQQQPIIKTQVQKVIRPETLIQFEKDEEGIVKILMNQFDLDPEIVSDLVDFEKHRMVKKKSKNFNKF